MQRVAASVCVSKEAPSLVSVRAVLHALLAQRELPRPLAARADWTMDYHGAGFGPDLVVRGPLAAEPHPGRGAAAKRGEAACQRSRGGRDA